LPQIIPLVFVKNFCGDADLFWNEENRKIVSFELFNFVANSMVVILFYM
jgi:hypothetical protein